MENDGNHLKNGNMEKDISKNEFNFLPDDPVTKDEFGSHKLVAESIGNKIESDDSGITIGLEGTWGSGKSSVILMLQERWEKRDDIKVFTFDAWAHQGDPLRRAFLEELIERLQSESEGRKTWLSKRPDNCDREYEKCKNCGKKLECRPDEIRDHLRLRREHDTIASEPTVTDWGKAFAIATLAMPIGVALLSAAPKLTGWYFWLGTILAASPLIIVGVCIIYRLFKKEHATNLLGEFVGKTKEVTKHTTQRSVDPTSIEFREYYWEILRIGLQNNKNKLVIIVDNLDRVETETALAIWSTMHTFLESHNYQESEIAKRIWLIVPYDPTSIVKLWGGKSDENGGYTGLARPFKEKTFQVRYRVASPLASRWEDYFKARMEEAFPESDEDTRHKIYHIFRIQALPGYDHKNPTPREMKLFINRMVALVQQHHPDVSIEEIALYAATELSEPNMLGNLVGYQSGQEKLFVDFVHDDWKYGLGAIQFGVSRKDAAEVLYEPRITKCLSSGDSDALKSLLENHGAPQCCERYVRNIAPELSIKEILIYSSAFAHYTLKDSDLYVRGSIRCLARRIAASGKMDWKFKGLLTEKNADDLIRVMEFNNSIFESVRNKLSIKIVDKDPEKIKEIDKALASWVKAAVKIIHYLASRKDFDPTLRLQMPNSETYLKILDMIVTEAHGKMILKFFCPDDIVLKSYLNDYLTKIQKGEIRSIDVDIVSEMLQMSCWKPEHIKRMASSLESAMKPDLPNDKTEYALRILYTQRKNTVFQQKLKNISENGRIFELLHQNHGQPSCAAFCLGTIFIYHPEPKFESGHAATNGQQKYNELLKNLDENIAHNIAKYCIEFDLLEDISKSVQNTDAANSECMKAVLLNLVKQDSKNDYLNTDRFIKCHWLIKFHLDEEEEEVNSYKTLLERLLKKDDSLLRVLKDRLTDVEFGHAYYIALKSKDLDTQSLAKKLCQELKTHLYKNDWIEQLRVKGWMLHVTIELVEKGCEMNLDNKFVDPLIEHARLILNGKVEIEFLEKPWIKLLDALSEAEREQFRRQLPDVLLDAQKPILSLISLYEDELEIAIQTADKPVKQRFVSQTCMQIADRHDPDELRWMITMFNKDKSLIKSGDIKVKEGLRNRLQDFLKKEYAKFQKTDAEDSKTDESDKNDREWLSAIADVAKQLGVKLASETKKESKEQ